MKVEFTDFYNQKITIHDETSSGNVRIVVRSCSDLNKCGVVPISECDVSTDISLDQRTLAFFIATLGMMESEER